MALVDELKTLQANVVQMYSQAHGYHWNVEGMLFKQFHAFFLEIYEDVYNSIDPISENIRKLGGKAPFGPASWLNNSTISINNSEDLSIDDMLHELIKTNAAVLSNLIAVFDTADEDDEQGVANFIAERIDQHQFWNWQLMASVHPTRVHIDVDGAGHGVLH